MPAIAQEVSYRKDIRPLWNVKCVACHGPSAPDLGEFEENKEKYKALSQGPRMDTYADMLFFIAWPDSGAIMRRLDRQLAGRAARHGDPGSHESWSFDSLAGPAATPLLLSRSIWNRLAASSSTAWMVRVPRGWAQSREERRRAVLRRSLLEQDLFWERRLSFAGVPA